MRSLSIGGEGAEELFGMLEFTNLDWRMTNMVKIRICLLGHPQVINPSGEVIDIRSKKGIAMLAMLATARQTERSRTWLQEKLWGTRDSAQVKASLRRELANLKKAFGKYSDCIIANNRSIKLDTRKIDIDVIDDPSAGSQDGEFLEGLDIPGEEEFEDWLRETRAHYNHGLPETEAVIMPGASKPTPAVVQSLRETDVKPAITVLPIQYDQSLSSFEINLTSSLQHRIIRNLTQLRWLHVCLPRDLSSNAAVSGTQSDCDGDYLLETHCWVERELLHVDLTLLSRRQNRVIWNCSEQLDKDRTREEQGEAISRCVNMLARQIDLAEQNLALGNGKSALDARAALWRLRHYHQRFDHTFTGTITQLIAEMERTGEFGNELLCVKAFNQAVLVRLGQQPEHHYDEVRRLCRDIMRLDPNDARGLVIAAAVDLWSGHYGQAQSYLEEAITLSPGYALAHALLGCHHYVTGDAQGAMAALEIAYRIDPMSEYHRFIVGQMAIVCAIMGDTARARALTRELRTFDPDAELAHFLDFTLHVTAPEPDQEPLLLCSTDTLKVMMERPRAWAPFEEMLAMEPFRSATELLETCA